MIYSFIRSSNRRKKVLQVLRIQITELLNFSFSSKQIGHSFPALITLYSWIWQYFVYMHIYTFYFETNKLGIYYSYTGKRFATGGCSLPFLQADEKFTELSFLQAVFWRLLMKSWQQWQNNINVWDNVTRSNN